MGLHAQGEGERMVDRAVQSFRGAHGRVQHGTQMDNVQMAIVSLTKERVAGMHGSATSVQALGTFCGLSMPAQFVPSWQTSAASTGALHLPGHQSQCSAMAHHTSGLQAAGATTGAPSHPWLAIRPQHPACRTASETGTLRADTAV